MEARTQHLSQGIGIINVALRGEVGVAEVGVKPLLVGVLATVLVGGGGVDPPCGGSAAGRQEGKQA